MRYFYIFLFLPLVAFMGSVFGHLLGYYGLLLTIPMGAMIGLCAAKLDIRRQEKKEKGEEK